MSLIPQRHLSISFCQCVESVQIRRFFWSVFFRIRTEYGEILRISVNVFKTFHAVLPLENEKIVTKKII